MRFLFVDRIVHLSPGELIYGLKHVSPDDAYLTQDQAGDACFIPSLIGETLGQLAAWNVMHSNEFTLRPVAGIVACARLHRPAKLGDTLLLESYIDSLDERAVQYHATARVGHDVVFSIEGALGPMLPMIDFIEPKLAKQQFTELYRPGDWTALCAEYQNLSSDEILVNSEVKYTSLMFDRVLFSEPGVSLVAQKRVTRAALYFPDHFPNKPVLPMTVLLECQLNLAQEFLKRAHYAIDYQVKELRKIKMNEFVSPGDLIVCTVKVKLQSAQELILSYRCDVEGKRVCVVDIVCHAESSVSL